MRLTIEQIEKIYEVVHSERVDYVSLIEVDSESVVAAFARSQEWGVQTIGGGKILEDGQYEEISGNLG